MYILCVINVNTLLYDFMLIQDATTLNIATLSIMIFSIMLFYADCYILKYLQCRTGSVWHFYCYAGCPLCCVIYAECQMLSVVMLNAIMLSVVAPFQNMQDRVLET